MWQRTNPRFSPETRILVWVWCFSELWIDDPLLWQDSFFGPREGEWGPPNPKPSFSGLPYIPMVQVHNWLDPCSCHWVPVGPFLVGSAPCRRFSSGEQGTGWYGTESCLYWGSQREKRTEDVSVLVKTHYRSCRPGAQESERWCWTNGTRLVLGSPALYGVTIYKHSFYGRPPRCRPTLVTAPELTVFYMACVRLSCITTTRLRSISKSNNKQTQNKYTWGEVVVSKLRCLLLLTLPLFSLPERLSWCPTPFIFISVF